MCDPFKFPANMFKVKLNVPYESTIELEGILIYKKEQFPDKSEEPAQSAKLSPSYYVLVEIGATAFFST